jgi:hypothetical protein
LRPEVFGEVVDEGVDLAEELDADLAQRRAGVVPQGDPVTHRIRLRWLSMLECPRQTRVCLSLGGDAMRVEPVGLALVTAALA